MKAHALLRDNPTIPCDPEDPNNAWPLALRDDIAVQLPAKHCAFRGCNWEGKDHEELVMHLCKMHAAVLSPIARFYSESYFSKECRMYAAYNAALTKKVQASAPAATYAIDRRCMYEYITNLSDKDVDSLICFCCARRSLTWPASKAISSIGYDLARTKILFWVLLRRRQNKS